MGKRARRKSDPYVPPKFGEAGKPEEVKNFDGNVSKHAVAAADKRLTGAYPYDKDPGSKPAIDPSTGKRREQ
ncbi:MAG TPA: hypothetical protein VFX97_20720 [Pyrinomonadaceae bacterium]|nr:hypothetical protein [Pyrinomonadaceae bacterium]